MGRRSITGALGDAGNPQESIFAGARYFAEVRSMVPTHIRIGKPEAA